MSAPHKGAGKADDPVLLGSSDDEAAPPSQAGPSRPRPRVSSSFRRTSLAQTGTIVDLTADDSSSDNQSHREPLFTRRSSSPHKTSGSRHHRGPTAARDTSKAQHASAGLPGHFGRGIARGNEPTPGSWGNPVSIEARLSPATAAQAGPSTSRGEGHMSGLGAWENPKPFQSQPSADIKDHVPGSGSWGNPVLIAPPPPPRQDESGPPTPPSADIVHESKVFLENLMSEATYSSLTDPPADISASSRILPQNSDPRPVSVPEGSWSNPTRILSTPIPDSRPEASQAGPSDASQPQAPGPGLALENSWLNPAPILPPALPELPPAGSCSDPVPIAISVQQPASLPMGSWEHPATIEAPATLKRAPSPTSPERQASAAGRMSKNGKLRRIDPLVDELPVDPKPDVSPKKAGPRWVTDNSVDDSAPVLASVSAPTKVSTSTQASPLKTTTHLSPGAGEEIRIDPVPAPISSSPTVLNTAPVTTPSTDPTAAASLLPVPAEVRAPSPQLSHEDVTMESTEEPAPAIVPEPSTRISPESAKDTPADTPSALGLVGTDELPDIVDRALRHPSDPHQSPQNSDSGTEADASAEIPATSIDDDDSPSVPLSVLAPSDLGLKASIDVDVKPAVPLVPVPAVLSGNSAINAIEFDTDDELACLTSDKEDEEDEPTTEQIEEAVEDVRIGVDQVDIAPSEQKARAVRRVSSTPSIEEIRPEDMSRSNTSGLRRTRRVSERVQSDESSASSSAAKSHALEMIRTRRQGKNRTTPSALSQPASPDKHGPDRPSTRLEVVIPTRSKHQWIHLVETGGESDVEDNLDVSDSPPSSGPSTAADFIDHGFTIRSTFKLSVKKGKVTTSVEQMDDVMVSPTHGTRLNLSYDPPVPPERVGQANRILNTRLIDEWNRRKPTLTKNPPLHRAVFEAYMAQCTSIDEPQADEIRVVNDVDGEGAPPDFEFQYSNDLLYNPDVPDPELGLGCDCEGPCDPHSKTCSCVKRQELYFYDLAMKGFAYDEHGHIRENSVSVWECGKNCGCPPGCMNRVIQRGRGRDTKIELFKTKWKGWGVRARAPIAAGTFLGIYAGELITEFESEERGKLYEKLGRTYLFDCDGWQIANPPAGLAQIDPRLAELAENAAKRAADASKDEDPSYVYSAYSVDAFHYGFTRYFNHSCDPNLAITQAYVRDFHPERPILVIFARRPIKREEELCISYKGLPDEEEIPLPVPTRKPLGRGNKKSKTSASAHVTGVVKAKVAAKDRCMCKTARCDGRMFNYGG